MIGDGIVAGAGRDDVGAAATVDSIGTGAAGDDVGAGRAGDRHRGRQRGRIDVLRSWSR